MNTPLRSPRTLYAIGTLIVLVFYHSAPSAYAQSVTNDWAISFGGANQEEIYDVVQDQSGNLYVTGRFFGSTDFDPGSAPAILTSAQAGDVFVAKYDSDGNYVWAVGFGGMGNDVGASIALGPSGDVYVIGSFEYAVDFNPAAGIASLTSNGNFDAFVATFTANGVFQNVFQIGGSFHDQGNGILVDTSGKIVITGQFYGTVDFDPGTGVDTHTSQGNTDIYVAAYDPAGNYLWSKPAGGTGSDYGGTVALDGAGNIYVSGYFSGTAIFDGSLGGSLPSAGNNDVFVASYAPNGNYRWSHRMGGSGLDLEGGLAVDDNANVYVAAHFQNVASFDNTTATFTSLGSFDGIISKYDQSGAYISSVVIGGSGNDFAYDVSVGSDQRVYVGGSFQNTVDFDPGTGVSSLSRIGYSDGYLAAFDQAGQFQWVTQIGGSGSGANVSGTTLGPDGGVYAVGGFDGDVYAEPGNAATILSSAGHRDIYLARFELGCDPTLTVIDAIEVLKGKIQQLGLSKGSENSFISKLENAAKSWGKGNTTATANQIGAFINALYATLPAADADLIAICAQAIIDRINDGSAQKTGLSLDHANAPKSFVLEGNYPNPFNPQTTIGFGLPAASRVTLKIYDMMGRVVQVLVNGVLTEGMHEATFDARSLPSGAYIYRLDTPAGSFTKTMLLMK